MKELKVGQKLYNEDGLIGTILSINTYSIDVVTDKGDRILWNRSIIENMIRNTKWSNLYVREEEPKLKTKNLNIYEVFTLLEKMPEGTLVEEKRDKMTFKLSKNGNKLINTTYNEYIDKFYTLKDLLFLTFDLVEESEEDKRKEQEKKRKEKEVSDLEKQIADIQSKIALLRLGME